MVIHDGIIFNKQFVDFGHPKTSMLRLCKKMDCPSAAPLRCFVPWCLRATFKPRTHGCAALALE